MNALEAGICLLYGFGIQDGGITKTEEDEIVNFCESFKKLGYTDDDILNEFNLISKLTGKGFEERFFMAVDYFKQNLDHAARVVMLDYITFVVLADGKVSDIENDLFNACCDHWGIDSTVYLDELDKIIQQLPQK